ncbi:MAG: GNAT family N-acetyltransferase [Saprospiraceae bacterium]|jgi:ribosomal-protein-alanine N-acetyltransferase|nr:GNAT family N-acetyltransferase [Saprospiraceae bacterium]MBL0026065.1 GNAT family N-acetyltransferase [Saprospiraceae bacterium]
MMTVDFETFPVLSSGRLEFRELSLLDVNEIFELRSDPELMKYIPRPMVNCKQDAIDHIEQIHSLTARNEAINWAITEIGQSKLIGTIGFYRIKPEDFRAELGYMILGEYHNKGFITESIRTVIQYAFYTLGFNSIEALIDPENIVSARVLRKNGFERDGHIRENVFWEGKFLDTEVFTILKKDLKKLSTP